MYIFQLFKNKNKSGSSNSQKTKATSIFDLTDNIICNRAVTNNMWDNNEPNYVNEAKRRGLTCGIFNDELKRIKREVEEKKP